jgi:hypothetical protein
MDGLVKLKISSMQASHYPSAVQGPVCNMSILYIDSIAHLGSDCGWLDIQPIRRNIVAHVSTTRDTLRVPNTTQRTGILHSILLGRYLDTADVYASRRLIRHQTCPDSNSLVGLGNV